ncbi:MAG: fumarylacetoacetate hydrolase family protein [Gammaproteobacteria bacterium]|nr:fumarylacetoacetate hydrolase family protein [Gammaproteobacteria bacterium]
MHDMTAQAVGDAARLLADLRLREAGRVEPLQCLPAACRPRTLDDAYAIQSAVSECLSRRSPGPTVGWKIGCTTRVMQQYLGIEHPCAGRLYRAGVHSPWVTLDVKAYFQLGLECEIAVRLGADCPPRRAGYRASQMSDRVEALMVSIEIVEHRFRDFAEAGAPSLIADDFFSAGCVHGEPVPLSDVGDPSVLSGGFWVDGEPPKLRGSAREILDDPMNALAWLADHGAAHGTPLRAGEIVTLGSVVKTVYPDAGTTLVARFEDLPEACVRLR